MNATKAASFGTGEAALELPPRNDTTGKRSPMMEPPG